MIKYLLEKDYPAGVALGRKLRNQKYESQHSG